MPNAVKSPQKGWIKGRSSYKVIHATDIWPKICIDKHQKNYKVPAINHLVVEGTLLEMWRSLQGMVAFHRYVLLDILGVLGCTIPKNRYIPRHCTQMSPTSRGSPKIEGVLLFNRRCKPPKVKMASCYYFKEITRIFVKSLALKSKFHYHIFSFFELFMLGSEG